MRRKLRQRKNKRVCVMGRVQKIHTHHNGIPRACIVNVRLKDNDIIIANHIWTTGKWIQAHNLKIGDNIQFYGVIRKYSKFNKYLMKRVSDYEIAQIRNVKRIGDQ